MKAKINIYKSKGEWCHATWIDGEFDSSEPIGIDPSATEEEAKKAVKTMYPTITDISVTKVFDV